MYLLGCEFLNIGSNKKLDLSSVQPNSVALKARVARWVPDLDLDLYEQAVRIRRAFLESLTCNAGRT